MFVITEAAAWAQENFGDCELGDKRRGARLIRVARDLARHAGSSLLKSCDGDCFALLKNGTEFNPELAARGCASS